jgi:hypothetical protein
MWLCHTCGELGRGGYKAVVTALEDHLTGRGHRSGTYSYGGPATDRESVTVCLAAGKPVHERRGGPAACEDAA